MKTLKISFRTKGLFEAQPTGHGHNGYLVYLLGIVYFATKRIQREAFWASGCIDVSLQKNSSNLSPCHTPHLNYVLWNDEFGAFLGLALAPGVGVAGGGRGAVIISVF